MRERKKDDTCAKVEILRKYRIAASVPSSMSPSLEEPFFDRYFTYSEYNIALSTRGNKSSPRKDGFN